MDGDGGGVEEETADEKEKDGGEGDIKANSDGDQLDGNLEKNKVTGNTEKEGGSENKKKSLYGLKTVKGEGKREGGGILKLGAGKKHKQTLAQIIPDRAHAIALAEAVVKNANAAAAAAAATRLDVPGGATIGLHQSHLAAHNDPSGTPKSRPFRILLLWSLTL